MKCCSLCKLYKINDAYYLRNGKIRMPCIECCSKNNKLYRNNNKQKIIAQRLPNIEQNRAIVNEIKNTPCKDCGKSFPSVCMDFDHLYDKKFNIAHGITRSFNTNKILEEIKKCEIVCANCHALRTYKRYKREKQYNVKRQVIKSTIDLYKNSPCTDCNLCYDSAAMQFDHVVPEEKSFNIGKATHIKNMTLQLLYNEIKKCELVCSNCHRIRTYIRK